MKTVAKSTKLANVGYDIRGPVLDKARQMEEEGQQDHQAEHRQPRRVRPRAARRDRAGHDPQPAARAGYTDSKGLFAPRRAVVHYTQEKHIRGVTVDDVYLGNGASELIAMSMNALLDDGDEVLMPAPDYPLWTAVVGAVGRHARCTTSATSRPAGCPTSPTSAARSRRAPGIVVINPNNPTGALYPPERAAGDRRARAAAPADRLRRRDLRQDAVRRQHAHQHRQRWPTTCCSSPSTACRKNYRSCGYRAGWMVVSGDKRHARGLHRGPEHAGLDAPVLPTRRGSWRSRPRWAATRASRTWWRRAGACAGSATWPTSC